MREMYKGYMLSTMSRAFTPKELFQAVQIKRYGFTVHDCLIGDIEHAKHYVDSVLSNDDLVCIACQHEQHDRCFYRWCNCPCAGAEEDYFELDRRDEEE